MSNARRWSQQDISHEMVNTRFSPAARCTLTTPMVTRLNLSVARLLSNRISIAIMRLLCDTTGNGKRPRCQARIVSVHCLKTERTVLREPTYSIKASRNEVSVYLLCTHK